MDNLPEIIEPTHPIYAALLDIQKPRSRYQLEKFVAGQHDTPEQQYRQILLEIQSLVFGVKYNVLEMKKIKAEIKELRASGNEIDAIEAEIKELGLEQTNLLMLGAQREIKDLVEMWEAFDHKYTHEEMEEAQPIYWDMRLTRQAALEHMGNDGKVGWASLDALRQIGSLDKVVMSDPAEIKELEK
jgi:hypothetical protein